MAKPYAILSDLHFHEWSAFAAPLESGINSRLQIILDEVSRAATELLEAGGNTMVLAGDIFHVRGSISPSVLNPVLDQFDLLRSRGVTVHAIAGNHDLSTKESEELGNAAAALKKVGVNVVSDPTATVLSDEKIVLVPWHSSPSSLQNRLVELTKHVVEHERFDLIIHAPVNGVLTGIPDHGLEPVQLAGLGFKRVFSGHYHNHVEFDGGVFSIGATTHQTWSDVGTKAGFLMVRPDEVIWRASRAPEFRDITAETDPEEIDLIAPGNYLRVKLEVENESDVTAVRDQLMGLGARGVVVHPLVKSREVVRTATTRSVSTLEMSVDDFVKAKVKPEIAPDVLKLCSEILGVVA